MLIADTAAQDELAEFLAGQEYCMLSTIDGAGFPHGLPARMVVQPDLTLLVAIPAEQLRRPTRATLRPLVSVTIFDRIHQQVFQGQGVAMRVGPAELPVGAGLEFQPSSCWLVHLNLYQLLDWGPEPRVIRQVLA